MSATPPTPEAAAWDAPVEVQATSVELLLFEIGPAVYAVDASQVLRIDRAGPEGIILDELGRPAVGTRALVFDTGAGEAQLVVDRVQGVVPAALQHLRRMPPVARCHAFALGMWLGAERPILLIDLPETARVSAP